MKYLFSSVAVMALGGVMGPHAVYAGVSATATVQVRIVVAMGMNNLTGMSFGAVTTSSSAGTVVVSTDGTLSASGGVTVDGGGSGSPASFQLSGEPGATYAIQLPDSVTLTDQNGNTLTVNGFNSLPGTNGKLDSSGAQVLKIGATLNVGPLQPYGDYSGMMTVAVSYN